VSHPVPQVPSAGSQPRRHWQDLPATGVRFE
jgi:hypothetical protein